MTISLKRKRKTTKSQKKIAISMVKSGFLSKQEVIERIKKHKLRFDIDYEKGLYDITPQEADIYDDSIDDILTIIRKLKK